jgi:hypothetical protein
MASVAMQELLGLVWGSLFTIESFGVAANHPPSGAQFGDVEVSAVSTDYLRTVTLHARPRLPEPLTTRNTGLTESLRRRHP